jgi:hypothetical protein
LSRRVYSVYSLRLNYTYFAFTPFIYKNNGKSIHNHTHYTLHIFRKRKDYINIIIYVFMIMGEDIMTKTLSPNKLSKLAHQNQFPFFTFFANQIIKNYERNNGGEDFEWKKGITLLERTSIKNLVPIQNQIHMKCLYAAISQNYADKEDRELAKMVAKYLKKKS